MKRKCPKCGSIEESKFCTNCGQDLSGADIVKICPKCGAETTSKFCIQCGTKMDQENVDSNKGSNEQKSVIKEPESKSQDIKQKEEEEKQRLAKQKEEEEKQRLAKLKEEEEKQRLAKLKEEEEKQRLAKLKEEEEKQRLAKQKEEEEKQRLAKLKEEEEKQRLAKQKEEERIKKEKIRSELRNKKKYEEALSYMEHAEQADDKNVAAEFFRKAEAMFDELLDWENAEENSLICARKAKACEIAAESKIITEKGSRNEDSPIDTSPKAETVEPVASKDNTKAAPAKEVPKGKSKSKIAIIAVLIGALVIGGAVIALTQGKTNNSQSSNGGNTAEDDGASAGGDAYQGDLIKVEDGPTIEWDTGSAVLTNYQIEKSEDEGDCVNLYFDYSKTGGEDESFSSALDVGVFQNGYELDEKSFLTTDAEDKSYDQVRSGASITAARGFLLNDASEFTVVLTAYDEDDNKIVERAKITIPDDEGGKISGSKKYFEDTGETPIKDGIDLKCKTGEVKIAGYKWTEYDGEEMLVLYFDFTNLTDEEQSMSGSDFNVTVFQNGVEQDSSGWTTSEAESHYFSLVQKGTTIHCGYSYSVPEKTEIEVKITCWADDDEKTEEQVVKVK